MYLFVFAVHRCKREFSQRRKIAVVNRCNLIQGFSQPPQNRPDWLPKRRGGSERRPRSGYANTCQRCPDTVCWPRCPVRSTKQNSEILAGVACSRAESGSPLCATPGSKRGSLSHPAGRCSTRDPATIASITAAAMAIPHEGRTVLDGPVGRPHGGLAELVLLKRMSGFCAHGILLGQRWIGNCPV